MIYKTVHIPFEQHKNQPWLLFCLCAYNGRGLEFDGICVCISALHPRVNILSLYAAHSHAVRDRCEMCVRRAARCASSRVYIIPKPVNAPTFSALPGVGPFCCIYMLSMLFLVFRICVVDA